MGSQFHSLEELPGSILSEIFQHVSQFDLANLAVCCSSFYSSAIDRLYRRVSVVLSADFALKYADSRSYILECGQEFMDSALILNPANLDRFLLSIRSNPDLLRHVRYFVFDKCCESVANIEQLQDQALSVFAKSADLNFLHVTFVDFLGGMYALTEFLANRNVRNRLLKLFVTSVEEFTTPMVPPALSNLFLVLDESELVQLGCLDLSKPPFDSLNHIRNLTCSTSSHSGLEILRRTKLAHDVKLRLDAFTVFHCHREEGESDLEFFNVSEESSKLGNELLFEVIAEKLDITNLTSLHLKVDCAHRWRCNCFGDFFSSWAAFLAKNKGLPKLTNFHMELFPSTEWLRPHQLLDTVLSPLGNFIKTLSSLSLLKLDFSTPGFKMFDGVGMSSMLLNKLSERLMEAFFLCVFTPARSSLRHIDLPDFLTSFVYYKPQFSESLLHTCRCWGCEAVLERMEKLFCPVLGDDGPLDPASSHYLLIGHILSKLQTDRELCTPIKQFTRHYGQYPIYKGAPNTLHEHFHEDVCDCNMDGSSPMNIDNLATTYIVHQLQPIASYLGLLFGGLETLMVHGIYFERNDGKWNCLFDDSTYPEELLECKEKEILGGTEPEGPFGLFGKGV